MSTSRTALLALAITLLALPLTLGKPGLPTHLKADEPAYLMMAASLAHDFDLEVEVADVDRVFRDFHYLPIRNLVVASSDGWETLTYGKPWVYSALGAPLVRLFGGNGLLVLNMVLFVGMIAAGAAFLHQQDQLGLALTFAAGFFLLSSAWAYVFWLQPEVFLMASGFFATLIVLRSSSHLSTARRRTGLVAFAAAGSILALGVSHKPMLAALALPALVAAFRGARPLVPLAAWGIGFASTIAAVAALSVAWTGTPSAYLGVMRQGVTLCEPGRLPLEDIARPIAGDLGGTGDRGPGTGEGTEEGEGSGEQATAIVPAAGGSAGSDPSPAGRPGPTATAASPTGGAWSWIFRVPPFEPRSFLESLGSFLWGRHTGLLPYMPFALVALAVFLLHRPRQRAGWAILGAAAAVGLFTLLFIPFNWHGGGGFVGNRYFVIVYPVFLLVMPRVPRWAVVVGTTVGALFLAPVLFAPFGLPVPEPTLQAHVRNFPFHLLPVEIQLRNVPGYHSERSGGSFVLARREQMLPRGEVLWIEGNARVELHVQSNEPETSLAVRVTSAAPNNTIGLDLNGEKTSVRLEQGEGTRIDFATGPGRRVDRSGGERQWVRRLLVETSAGRNRLWQRPSPPRRCEAFAWSPEMEDNFWLGAELVILGRPEHADADVFSAQWRRLLAPETLAPGARASARARLVNTSQHPWLGVDQALGAARVKLVPRWIAADGTSPLWDAPRIELPRTVTAGEELIVSLPLEAPASAGDWQLEVDLVFEHVGWFSHRGVAPARAMVRVEAATNTPTPAASRSLPR